MKIWRKAVFVLFLTSITNAAAQSPEPQIAFAVERQAARLNSPDVEIRRDAVQQLRLLENAEAARVAVQTLADAAEIVRAVAAEAAAFLPEAEAAAFLNSILARDKSEFVRREAAFALGLARSKNAVSALVQALQTDKQSSVRAAAAIALGKIADARGVAALSETLLAPDTKKNRKTIDEFVRRSAARALGEIGDKSAAPILIDVLRERKNPDDVRREAAYALGLVADVSAVEILSENANAEDYLLAEIARAALAKIHAVANPQKGANDR